MDANESNLNLDLPVALRRGKRPSSAISPVRDRPHSAKGARPAISVTPSRRSAKKKARFSDSDLLLGNPGASTGLTPHIHESSLYTPRRATSVKEVGNDLHVQFTPFRETLSRRCQRRIGRNGLSQEMNDHSEERKREVALLKDLEVKDDRIRQLTNEVDILKKKNTTEVKEGNPSARQIDETEAEFAAIRCSFDLDHQEQEANWDGVQTGSAAGPRSDSGDTIPIFEDEDATANVTGSPVENDIEMFAVAPDLETAKQAKSQLFKSARKSVSRSEFQFVDSPASLHSSFVSSNPLPSPPRDYYRSLEKTLKATTNRAEEAELALKEMDVELKSLGFAGDDAGAIIGEIASQFRTARLELEREVPGETTIGFSNSHVLSEICKKLKMLNRRARDRESELKTMREQQKSLKGNFDHAILTAGKANARIKDLEEEIDKMSEEMLQVRMKSQALEREVNEKDKTVASLIAALDKYRQEVSLMEGLIIELESKQAFKIHEATERTSAAFEQRISDLDARVAAEQTGRRAAERSAVGRLAKIQELEAGLLTAGERAAEIQAQLLILAAEKEKSELELKSQLSTESIKSAKEIGVLSTRISNQATALASATAEVDKIMIANKKLQQRLDAEIKQSALGVENMQKLLVEQMEQAKTSFLRELTTRQTNWKRENQEDVGDVRATGLITPMSVVRFATPHSNNNDGDDSDDHVEGSVQVQRGRKGSSRSIRSFRRKHDSGIGMETLYEDDDTSTHPMTPDLSSDADLYP